MTNWYDSSADAARAEAALYKRENADLRARLESVEAERNAARTALRTCYEYIERTIPMMGVPDAIQRRADVLNGTRDALGAAGEEKADG